MSTVVTWDDDAGALVSFVFDVDNQETHELVTEVTEFPVEDGADVADNARDQLATFTLDAYVGERMLASNPQDFEQVNLRTVELQIPEKPLMASASAVIGAAVSAVGAALFGGGSPKAMLYTFDNPRSRKKVALALIDEARKARRLCRVLTSMRTYENMLITQVSVTRSPETGDGANFTLVFKEVRFVESEVVDAPKPSEPIGKPKVKSGSKNASDDSESKAAAKQDNRSGLARGADEVKRATGGN